ncbi:MAG: peptidyl-prolyl cis-trans isomerase [Tyzzerella sp.]|nr:peptidyl-prolyl cis-trans isomerase [Tyzzerella sp.]
MKKMIKKVAALAAVAAMTVTALVGCASSSVDNSAVVATVGETEITTGLVNFYIRYQQSSIESMYEAYYGDQIWSLEIEEGVTYEEYLVDTTMDMLEEYYLLDAHKADYEVSLSEDELAAIDEAAEAFVKANKDDVIEKISGQKEYVAELLRLFTISEKMYEPMTADINREVSDDEAAQKRLAYVGFSIASYDENGVETKLSDEEIADKKKEAEDVLAAAKANGSLYSYAEESEDYTAHQLTFDAESTSIAEEVIEIADKLAEGEFAEVIETDATIYVVQLESLLDVDATATEKDNIILEREEARYTEIVDGWKEESGIKIDESVLEQINVKALKVMPVEEEEEETEE